MSVLDGLKDRTDAKLRFVNIHLEELKKHHQKGSGDDFERSHQESFLYLLVGVRDAFFQELNEHFKVSLPLKKVRKENLKDAFEKIGISSPELQKFIALEGDQSSWLSLAIEMRDHGTHRHHIPRHVYVGGKHDGQVHLEDTRRPGQTAGKDFIDEFDGWFKEMENLIKSLRRW